MTTAYTDLTTDQIWAERRRLAALRDPAMMGRYLDPRNYHARAHTKLIASKLAQLRPGGIDRLMVFTPPQVGKSVLVSERMPFWWLAKHPRDRVIIGSYAADLAKKKSRAVRAKVEEHGAAFGLHTDPSDRSVTDWSLTTGGGVKAAGVDSSLTGFPGNCISGDVYIDTPSGRMPIGEYVETSCPEPVLSFDHRTQRPVWARVVATSTTIKETVEVLTASGRTVRCTPDHRFYVPDHGYVEARHLTAGTPLLTAHADVPVQLREMPEALRTAARRSCQGDAGGQARTVLLPVVQQLSEMGRQAAHAVPAVRRTAAAQADAVLLGKVQDSPLHRDSDLSPVRQVVHDAAGGLPQTAQAEHRRPTHHLLQEVHGGNVRGRTAQAMPDVWHATAQGEGRDLLLVGVQEGRRAPASPAEAARDGLSAVRAHLPAEVIAHGVLLTDVRERGARAADDRPGELAVQGRRVVRKAVPVDAPGRHGSRRPPLRGMQGAGDFQDHHPQGQQAPAHDVPRAPHQRGPEGQPTGEPRDAVRHLPRSASPLGRDTVAMVRPVRGGGVRVYDLQVEGTSNFFAGSVLVHNCAIIDDPHKNRKETESKVRRDTVWSWWSSTVLTRLSPGAPVVLVQTRWHQDDLAGRLLRKEGRVEDGGRWVVVNLPAIATAADDPLGREVGDPLTHPLIDDADREALERHWQDKRGSVDARDWGALYQGDPKPREGALLKQEQVEHQRAFGIEVGRLRRAVAVDPSGGGKDTAGVVAGFLGDDQRVYLTHDWTRVMPSTEWARQACLLAYETGAQVIYVEKNFGGDLSIIPVAGAWDQLQREGRIPKSALKPWIEPKNAKSGKYLRAEPIAQAWLEDRVRTYAYMPEMENEWETWVPGSADSPGRIDASVYLVYGLLQLPGSEQHIGSAAAVSLQQAAGTQAPGGLGGISLGRGR